MVRRYTKKRRAQSEEETRQRIIESAVSLHQEEGGNTTITAIAERAGVGRVTVYRHFADEPSLLTACTGHYIALHPPPDLERWASITDPLARLRHGLTETYAYHRQTEAMMTVAEREVAANPVLAGLLEPLQAYWDSARQILSGGWTADDHAPRLVEETIGLALSLPAWRILTVQQGLSDADCVSLFATAIEHLVCQGVAA